MSSIAPTGVLKMFFLPFAHSSRRAKLHVMLLPAK